MCSLCNAVGEVEDMSSDDDNEFVTCPHCCGDCLCEDDEDENQYEADHSVSHYLFLM